MQNFFHGSQGRNVTFQRPETLSDCPHIFEPVSLDRCRLTDDLTLVPQRTQDREASHIRATSHPQIRERRWGARLRSTRVRGIPPKNASVKERHIHSNEVFVVNARSCRSRDANFPTTYHSRQFSIQGILTRYRPTFLKIGTQPGAFVKAWIIIPAPHFPLSQLPSQNRQSPMTSDHMTWASSTHSSSRPFTPVAAHRSASLLCSRKICVAKSAIRCRRSSPRPHHSRRRFWVATVLSFVFQLGMTVDPVHNRFAVPHDIWGFLRYFKLEGRQFPGFLCRPGPICLGLLLHGLFHGPK